MSTLQCSNCKIEVANDDSLKVHYKSEFHRYNIKRHLVNLPPITHDQFLKKKTEIVEAKKGEKESILKCTTCNKSFSSKPTYKQHMESKKHQEAENNLKRGAEIVTEKPEPKAPRVRVTTVEDQSVCLFCNEKSNDIDENLVHMRLAHSFFVSDMKYIKNLAGLLKYLGEKIHKGCLCILCENHQCKDFKSGEAVQSHMIDKGHCFMKTEDFDEYHKYYDFTKSLDDMRNKMYLGDMNEPLQEGEEYLEMESSDDEDDGKGWEDVDDEDEEDDDEEEDGEEEGEGKEKKEGDAEDGAEKKEKKPKRVYRYKVRKVKVLDSGEIQLPNGTILGHRKYRHVYKQYFRESLQQNFSKQKYLGFSEETTLVRAAQANRLMLMKDMIDRQLKLKERMQSHKIHERESYHFVKLGLNGNYSTRHHYKNANPL